MLERLQGNLNKQELQPCISLADVQELHRLSTQVKVARSLQEYMLQLVRATREHDEVTLGISPRGTVALHRTTQAYAYLAGRDYAIPDDVKYLAPYVLAHRMIPTGGRRAKTIIDDLLNQVPIP